MVHLRDVCPSTSTCTDSSVPRSMTGEQLMKTSRSVNLGITFSIPITVISVCGSVRHIRPLPSDSTTASVPVSATLKLARSRQLVR